MIPIVTVLACIAFMLISAWLGKGYNIAEAENKYLELKKRMLLFDVNTSVNNFCLYDI